MDLGVRDRVFLLSGASRGLGRATAEVLVAEGAYVVISARDEDAVQRTAASLGTARAVGVAADNADPASAERLVATAMAKWGRLDGALISVGGPPAGSAMDTDEDEWRRAFESIYLGTLRLCRAVAAACRDGGSIAFVLSSSVRSPIANLAISNGLRPGLAGLAKTFADELGPAGVRVNSLLPGSFDTERTRELAAQSGDPEAYRRRREAEIPLRRFGSPAEFGRVAAFILSPVASYVTGTTIAIDGGALRAI
ncbi:3-oxoacyl-[acyl-carrier protein] reductase [Thermasporomyces composti]|mgnify:CR=1 FL=1|uniref:3-oxoacyl-[acyl-carrier protein] reductase n=1 Tax=Thermasporomyces composti TaxID=696763 RepID=A0A3D9V0G7_THECX|nr:3-oxoacyl-[acyl-carrier protein] reductase [Thermasporomyces composti]